MNLPGQLARGAQRPTLSTRRSRGRWIRRLGIGKAIALVALGAWAVLALFPLYWMFVTGFKTQLSCMSTPPQLLPRPATLRNYITLFRGTPIVRWVFNGFVYAGVLTGFDLFACTLIGYLLAKKDFPGKNLYFWANIATMTVPLAVYVVPLYKMTGDLKMLDTYQGLILPWIFSPVGIFMMKQFLQTLPNELLDAGKIDGCNEWRVFTRIVFPLSKPGMGVYGIYTFMGCWNDFFWPLIITQSREMRILPVGLATLQANFITDYGLLMAGASVAAIPMIIIFFSFQSFFIQGITVGAIKG